MKQRILVVEDDAHISDGLRINLALDGYEPILAANGEDGLEYWRKGGIDLVLLDIMLPGIDGFEVCRQIRDAGDRVPVLFLTARSASFDRVRGLDEGGDDYITKPFELTELLARIKSIFRRQDWFRGQETPQTLSIGRAEINLRAYQAVIQGQVQQLKEKEVMILRLLLEHEGEPVDRETILDRVWGFGAYPTTRTVDNFILALRKVVEIDPAQPRHILTVHGVGYRIICNPAG